MSTIATIAAGVTAVTGVAALLAISAHLERIAELLADREARERLLFPDADVIREQQERTR